MTTGVCLGTGAKTETAGKDRTESESTQRKSSTGDDPQGGHSHLDLDLATQTVVRVLRYLHPPAEHTGSDFVEVSKMASDLGSPLNTVVLVVERLTRAGYLRSRGPATDEVALDDCVRDVSLREVISSAAAPGMPEDRVRQGLSSLNRLSVKDILPTGPRKLGVPIRVRIAAAAVLGLVFCIASFGLCKVPTAFAAAGATILIVSYTLHWLGRRGRLDTLPQCILEATMAGSVLWVVFGLVGFLW